MKTKELSRLGGIIDIGSSQVVLKIKENKKNTVTDLENLSFPLNIGRDTFTLGKISVDNVTRLERIITNYCQIIDSYSLERYRIIATTAMQEAANRDFILDQLKIKTGKKINVLDDREAKYLIVKEMCRLLSESKEDYYGRSLVAYIGTGNLVVSIYEDGQIHYSQNIQIGSLKLSEMLGLIQEKTENFHQVIEEYLNTFTFSLKNNLIPNKTTRFIASGREIELIAELCQTEERGEMMAISREELEQLYEKVKHLTPEQIQTEYALSEEAAEILIPSLAIYKTILHFTEAKEIIALHILISDALLHEMLFPKTSRAWNRDFEKNILISAHNIGNLFNYDYAHSASVEKHCLFLFDELKNLHGMKRRERLLLQIAAKLHECGKHLSLKDHNLHSYYLIKNTEILGLSNSETEIVASIARYHSSLIPGNDQAHFSSLPQKDRLIVARLTAILRMADALNRSHLDKFSELRLSFKNEELLVSAYSDKDTWLEDWTFKKKAGFFTDVFGVNVRLEKESGEIDGFI